MLASAVLAIAAAVSACTGGSGPAESRCEDVEADLAPLLDAGWSDVASASSLPGKWSATRAWVEHQLVTHDEWVTLGSCSIREGHIERARRAFTIASRRVRHSTDSAVGLGYVALRSNHPTEAIDHFCMALDRSARSQDARQGLRLALERLPVGDPAAAKALRTLERTLTLATASDEDRYLLALASRRSGGSGEVRRRDADTARGHVRYDAKVGHDYLEVQVGDGSWRSVFIQGVNIGPALPGRFPSEAPEDEAAWEVWLNEIARLGANSVRVYTLQPPAFYRALARHNSGPESQRLWLLQGIWADLPPRDDFDEADYVAGFKAEISRVIDAVHGNLVLDPARGTARGVFDADVSRQTLAWIVGREWEPYAVADYLARQPGDCSVNGRFVKVERGNAMECWISRMLDFAADYEARNHGVGRPLTFANWPTLDPLEHPTESTRAEEDQLRHQLYGTPLPDRNTPAWDDDAVSVDASRILRATDDSPGVFASYHVYPNFPYFMYLEPGYASAVDEDGPLRYAGYLRALKAHHGTQPVVVAEFGMSTSRGIAHVQSEGLHHGGHDEAEAMRQSGRLLRAIHATGMAGGVAFEFIDEWFKGTWSTSPFEVPDDHRPRWFNAESPEQSYGLFAARPVSSVRVDGDPGDWTAIPVLAEAAPEDGQVMRALRATYDAGWVYLLLETSPAAGNLSGTTLEIGIDTYSAERGERQLPPPAACSTATGVEFVVVLEDASRGTLLVSAPYLQRHPAEAGGSAALVSPLEPSHQFLPPSLETNRERHGRDGTRFPPIRVSPGKLLFGSLDPAAPGFDTRSDVAVGRDGTIEIRLPWSLLNFADPSGGLVLHSPAPADELGTAPTGEIRFYACSASAGGAAESRALPTATLPLHPWSMPEFKLEPKNGLDQLRQAYQRLPSSPRAPATPTEATP